MFRALSPPSFHSLNASRTQCVDGVCIVYTCIYCLVVERAALHLQLRITHWKRATNIISLWKMIINYMFLLQSRGPRRKSYLHQVPTSVPIKCVAYVCTAGTKGDAFKTSFFFTYTVHIVLNAVTFSNRRCTCSYHLKRNVYFRFFFITCFTRLWQTSRSDAAPVF